MGISIVAAHRHPRKRLSSVWPCGWGCAGRAEECGRPWRGQAKEGMLGLSACLVPCRCLAAIPCLHCISTLHSTYTSDNAHAYTQTRLAFDLELGSGMNERNKSGKG